MLFAQGVSALGAVCECFGRRAGGQRRVSALISVMMGVWSPTQCQWERRCARARYDPRQALTAEPLWLAEACRLTLARAARDGQRLQSLLGPRNTCGQRLKVSTAKSFFSAGILLQHLDSQATAPYLLTSDATSLKLWSRRCQILVAVNMYRMLYKKRCV